MKPVPVWKSLFEFRVDRFARDVLGLALVLVPLLIVAAAVGAGDGSAIYSVAQFFSEWLGWGVYFLAFGAIFAGTRLINRSAVPLGFGRIFSLELGALLTLGVLALIVGDRTLALGNSSPGGIVGWGLLNLIATGLGPVLGPGLLVLAWVGLLGWGLGIWGFIESRLAIIAGEEPARRQFAVQDPLPEPVLDQGEVKTEERGVPKRGSRRRSSESDLLALDERIDRPARNLKRVAGMPPMNLLLGEQSTRTDERNINQTAGLITKTLSEFGIPATVIGYRVGPAITQFAVQPGFIRKGGEVAGEDAQTQKVRVAQIAGLRHDLALSLSAERLRIEAPVPGKAYVGIEVPNSSANLVRLRGIMESESFHRNRGPLSIALGRDVSGHPMVVDLGRMPHLLIAGQTGSGKSVCVTSIAACLAMNNSPEDLRMVMIDSKMVELLRFNGLPHLLGKVETNVERILGVLRWVVGEMEHRYRLLEVARTRDLSAYNKKQERKAAGQPLPRIVVLIDELADLMMHAPDQTETSLVRLAQMARATGIHLVVATQRPSTDVVTGLIKANFPARLAFAVASGVDSRVILDAVGAETLLGKGDMLFLNPEVGSPSRAQGVIVTDSEIDKIVEFWRKQVDSTDQPAAPWERILAEPEENEDEDLLGKATTLVRSAGRASASMLQRRLRIGYPRAARLLDQLEDAGIVGPSTGGGRDREIMPYDSDESELS